MGFLAVTYFYINCVWILLQYIHSKRIYGIYVATVRNTFSYGPVGLIWKALGFLRVRLNLACVMLNIFFSVRTDHGRLIISFSQGTAKYGDMVWRARG